MDAETFNGVHFLKASDVLIQVQVFKDSDPNKKN